MNVRPLFNRLLPLGLALGLGASVTACDDGAKKDAKPQAEAKAESKADPKADPKLDAKADAKPEGDEAKPEADAKPEGDEAKPEGDEAKPPKGTKSKPKKKPDPKPEPAAASGVDGKALYLKKCKNCHGTSGAADTKIGEKNDIPSWKEPGWKGKWSLSKVKDITNNGKSGTKMKPFKKKLTAAEIDAVSAYARGLGK